LLTHRERRKDQGGPRGRIVPAVRKSEEIRSKDFDFEAPAHLVEELALLAWPSGHRDRRACSDLSEKASRLHELTEQAGLFSGWGHQRGDSGVLRRGELG
jgi:hypothetical protein